MINFNNGRYPCTELPCKDQPPPAPEGEGSERVFGVEVTKYRCKNGYMWENGKWPYLEMECLNRKWSPKTLPECIRKYQVGILTHNSEFSTKLRIDNPHRLHGNGNCLAVQEAGVGRLNNIHLPKSDHHLGGDAGGPGGQVRLAQAD